MKRTPPFSRAAIRNACLAAAFAVVPVGVYAVGSAHNAKTLAACNSGELQACHEVVDTKKAEITNQEFIRYEQVLKLAKDEANAKSVREESERKAKVAEDYAKTQAQIAERQAKFQAEGWWQASDGVFVRWCTDKNPCPGSASDHYSDYVWRAMVWCKDRSCGDIYARMNIESGGAVIGWTNDTAYGDLGQKVVLTFGSHLHGQARIVEFKARG